jgi:hypothetical protein
VVNVVNREVIDRRRPHSGVGFTCQSTRATNRRTRPGTGSTSHFVGQNYAHQLMADHLQTLICNQQVIGSSPPASSRSDALGATQPRCSSKRNSRLHCCSAYTLPPIGFRLGFLPGRFIRYIRSFIALAGFITCRSLVTLASN